MEVILLSKEEYQNIINTLNEIKKKLDEKSKKSGDEFIDNAELIMRLKVSSRTVYAWRSEGKITYSKVGSKLYYKLSDIEDFLSRHRWKHFK